MKMMTVYARGMKKYKSNGQFLYKQGGGGGGRVGSRYTKPGLQAEKKAELTIQKEYSDNGLPQDWIQYSQTVRHRYILFVFMGCSFFIACSPGLVYLGP